MADSPMIEWEGLTKAFLSRDGASALKVIDNVSLQVARSEFVGLVGPSGCGKSTLLNMAAGLDAPSEGTVRYGGAPLTGINQRVGYMTQKDTLLPWKTAADNIAIPLRIRGLGKRECAEQAQRYLELVGMGTFGHFYPGQLSGGMRKRVALARTLIYQPETLLMDEPFGALDVQIRLLMQQELVRLLEHEPGQAGKTVVFVTHDLREAIALSDRVIVLTARPARIRLERRIPFPRPRDPLAVQFLPEFEAIHKELWSALEGEVGKGTDA